MNRFTVIEQRTFNNFMMSLSSRKKFSQGFFANDGADDAIDTLMTHNANIPFQCHISCRFREQALSGETPRETQEWLTHPHGGGYPVFAQL